LPIRRFLKSKSLGGNRVILDVSHQERICMKVFLSWSGTRSHQVALIFRDWLPSVIQAIVPYVSSEDIDKGARWSTDIAKELEDSTFGILCVTRENINAPWLTFEAGALSKTMDKSFVSPFLFDIKRSEVDGPLLQFQSTILDKDDIKKLLKTLNKACDADGLAADRLEKAFDVWYPTLESELAKLRDNDDSATVNETSDLATPKTVDILEEILELSRSNQKLIRNPEGSFGSGLDEIRMLLRELYERADRGGEPFGKRSRRLHPMMLEEIIHMLPGDTGSHIGLQIALAMVRHDLPWLYDTGIETINILKSDRPDEEKQEAFQQFDRLLDLSFEHPMMRELYGRDKESRMIYRKISSMLRHSMQRAVDG